MKLPSCSFLLLLVPGTLFAQAPAPEVTEHHKVLQVDVGTWAGKMQIYTDGPDAKPMVIPAKETNQMMSGDLWLLSEFESGPFRGRGQFGYDPSKKKYVGTWVDNSSPHLTVMEGDYDPKTKATTMFSRGVDPATGKIEDMKSVSTSVSADKRTFVMYTKKTGEWVKSFEVELNRVK